MIEVAENPRAVIGDNMPADPYAAMQIHVETLFETAQGFLDGDPITDQQTADTVSMLIDEARKARKDADAMRKDEVKPHDEARAAVQAKWMPLLARLELVNDTAKRALVPFLAKKEAERIEAERLARLEADRKAEEARQALAEAGTDITARADAETVLKAADKATKAANRIGKEKAQATGGSRAIGLRTHFFPVLTDAAAALKHYRAAQPAALKAWLIEQAEKDVRSGSRAIPGFNIESEQVAQ